MRSAWVPGPTRPVPKALGRLSARNAPFGASFFFLSLRFQRPAVCSCCGVLLGSPPVGVADADGVCEESGVGDEDAVAVCAVDQRSAHLNVGHGAFDAGDADPVAYTEGLVEKDQDAG